MKFEWEKLKGKKVLVQFKMPCLLAAPTPHGPAPVSPPVPEEVLVQMAQQGKMPYVSQPFLVVDVEREFDGGAVLVYETSAAQGQPVHLHVPDEVVAFVSEVSDIVVASRLVVPGTRH
jgi:hypothetical protein